MNLAITSDQLTTLLPTLARPPVIIDARPHAAYLSSARVIEGSIRLIPEQFTTNASLFLGAQVVVFDNDDAAASTEVVNKLRALGLQAMTVDDGFDGWSRAGGKVLPKPMGAPTTWVTRARPKVDRVACPWLILRMIDPDAKFLYVPADDVRATAAQHPAIPYDIPNVTFSHEGALCSFDAMIHKFGLSDPALLDMAVIVRGADTAVFALAPQAAGLVAISLGLSRLYADDHAMLAQGLVLYDALYAWCRDGRGERHDWNPAFLP
ncbi:MAG: chromate resistance protein [Rhodospirillaceae bacterium]|nr:chromate resistance protein [Rhodospirillaceae bacterium]